VNAGDCAVDAACSTPRAPYRSGTRTRTRRATAPTALACASPVGGKRAVTPRCAAHRAMAARCLVTFGHYDLILRLRPRAAPCRCPRCRRMRVEGRCSRPSFPAGSTRLRGPRLTPRATLEPPGSAKRCPFVKGIRPPPPTWCAEVALTLCCALQLPPHHVGKIAACSPDNGQQLSPLATPCTGGLARCRDQHHAPFTSSCH
jgi:hypothetical protein